MTFPPLNNQTIMLVLIMKKEEITDSHRHRAGITPAVLYFKAESFKIFPVLE